MPKPFAAFDLDGSFYMSSLVEKSAKALVDAEVFAPEPFERVHALRKRYQVRNTEGSYTAYLDELVGAFVTQMAGIEVERFEAVTSKMIAQERVRRFAFPQELARRVAPTHYPLAISGSPVQLVRPFLADLPMRAVFGSEYDVVDGTFTGVARSVGDKVSILRALQDAGEISWEGSIAIGDTMSDRHMLKFAQTAIMFNASQTLTDFGKTYHWPRVNEVKDQITALQWDQATDRYIEMEPYSLIPT